VIVVHRLFAEVIDLLSAGARIISSRESKNWRFIISTGDGVSKKDNRATPKPPFRFAQGGNPCRIQ
jgi:hypothetical protein